MDKPRVTFFDSGQQMAFSNGEQVFELQQPWIVLFFEWAERQGYNPLEMEFILPDGRPAIPFRTDEGWNWDVI